MGRKPPHITCDGLFKIYKIADLEVVALRSATVTNLEQLHGLSVTWWSCGDVFEEPTSGTERSPRLSWNGSAPVGFGFRR